MKLAGLDLARRTYRDLGLKFVWKMIGSWRLMCVKGFEMKL